MLYFNNPFAEPIFARVLANVRAAHERSRGKFYFLYQQLAGELETDRTQNVAMLERSAFLRERHVRFPSRWSRYLLGSYELRMFESVDPASPSSSMPLKLTAPRPRRSGRERHPHRQPLRRHPRSRTSGRSNSRSTSRPRPAAPPAAGGRRRRG